ncbi:MAG: alpha/beta fold hydrolase [Armatimonadetes bacterium]|nr:MAG: alpha/beta fold hydrolase [Armatimonadota bacterium]
MWRWLVVFVVLLVGVGVMLWAFQRQLIYFPSQAVGNTPVGVEEVRYPTADGLELTGWLVPSTGPPQGTVIMFPGNAGNRSARVSLGRALADAGYGTLLVDYRGYGGNPGSPSEQGLRLDARAALAYVESRVDSDTIIYFGESLGSGVAVELASEHPPAAVVLRSPFTSLDAVASVHYPYLPVSLLLRDRFDNTATIRNVEAPILIIAGSEDRIVPPELSRELHDLALDPKDLVIIDGADHNDARLVAGTEMIDAVTRFLDRIAE